jgi:predicted DNA-binding transcriptional regulator AlpA
MVNVDHLVGLNQISAKLGVSPTTVDNWIQGIRGKGHKPFPEHIAIINSRTRVWDWTEVEQWYEEYKPQRGGAPSGDRNGKRKNMTVRTERGWRNAG